MIFEKPPSLSPASALGVGIELTEYQREKKAHRSPRVRPQGLHHQDRPRKVLRLQNRPMAFKKRPGQARTRASTTQRPRSRVCKRESSSSVIRACSNSSRSVGHDAATRVLARPRRGRRGRRTPPAPGTRSPSSMRTDLVRRAPPGDKERLGEWFTAFEFDTCVALAQPPATIAHHMSHEWKMTRAHCPTVLVGQIFCCCFL